MNIQYEYDLLSANWSCLEFIKATQNDQADSRETLDKVFKKKGLGQMELNMVLSEKHKLESRMVIVPIPDDVYQERIRKASRLVKNKGCQLSNQYKIKARYNIFITNVPADRLFTEDIIQVYRLRWQIELVFYAKRIVMQSNLRNAI